MASAIEYQARDTPMRPGHCAISILLAAILVLHLAWQPLAAAPEPGVMSLFAAGLVVLLAARRKSNVK